MRLEDHAVGAELITTGEKQEIALHEILRVDHQGLPIAANGGATWKERAESLGGVLGPQLLREGEAAVEQDHHDHGDAELRHPGDECECRGDPEEGGEEVRQLGHELSHHRRSSRGGEEVRPVARQTLRGLRRRQPTGAVHARLLTCTARHPGEVNRVLPRLGDAPIHRVRTTSTGRGHT